MAALRIEEGEQLAAGNDAGFFPFSLQADVDDRHTALDQFFELGVVDVDHFGMSDAAESEQAGRKEVTHGGFRVSENADYRYLAPVVLSPFRLRGSTGVG